MRKHLLPASATLAIAIAVLPACGATPTGSATSPSAAACVDAAAPHHAYVVVHHLDARHELQRCVGFSGDTIDGQTLMEKAGIEFETQTFSFGKAMCQVDDEPAQFSKCFADSGPNWSLMVDTGGKWTLAETAYTAVTLHDGDALGWIYTADPSPSPPALPTPVAR